MGKNVGVIIVLGIILISGFGFALKSFDATGGTSLTLDNGICESVELAFNEGESKTFTLEGQSFTVKYLGAKIVDYNYDSDDLSGIEFMKVNEKRSSEDSSIESIFEFEGETYRYLPNIFQNKLGGLYLEANFYTVTESEWVGDKHQEIYMGTAMGTIHERERTTDCEGFDESNEWGNSYIDAIQFHAGWNLVPRNMRINKCRGEAASQICYNDFLDKPITYILEPVEKKYYTEKWIEEYADSKGNDYWNNYEEEFEERLMEEFEERGLDENSFDGEELSTSLDFMLDFLKEGEVIMNLLEFDELYRGAQWVYIEDNLAGKYLMRQTYSSIEGAFGVALFEGWNLQYVYSDYIFSNNNNREIISRSLNDLKGTCEIEGAFFFDAPTQEWKTLDLDYKFAEDDLNKGIAIKVKGDCRIGKLRADRGLPPVVPAS